VAAPIYFLTEDEVTRGATQVNVLTGEPFPAVDAPTCVESVVATLPTGDGRAEELWKLNHYYERLDEWNADHGIPADPFAAPAAEPAWELHNLTADPEERTNLAAGDVDALRSMRTVLDQERDAKRLVPQLRNA
jgi:hypothetical protein